MATLNDGSDGSCCQKISNEAAAILESLYSSGMTGWGRDHSDSISTAISSTGLRGHVQTIFGKINVIVTLREGPPPPLNVMDLATPTRPHPLLGDNIFVY